MIAHVYRPRRKNKVGKSAHDRLYRGRYRFDGDYDVSAVALSTSDKQTAGRKLRDIIEEKERERAGIIASKSLRTAATKPLTEHLDDFTADLKALGRDPEYVSASKIGSGG